MTYPLIVVNTELGSAKNEKVEITAMVCLENAFPKKQWDGAPQRTKSQNTKNFVSFFLAALSHHFLCHQFVTTSSPSHCASTKAGRDLAVHL